MNKDGDEVSQSSGDFPHRVSFLPIRDAVSHQPRLVSCDEIV